MDDIFDQILGALDAGFPYAAIVMAVAIPDICANLLLPEDAKSNQNQSSRYKRWYNQNLQEQFPYINADDFYSIRCGVVHQGRFSNKKMKTFDRILFSSGGDRFSSIKISGILTIETRDFCVKIIGSAKNWLERVQDDQNVMRNSEFLVRPRPDGFPGYIRGVPVIG